MVPEEKGDDKRAGRNYERKTAEEEYEKDPKLRKEDVTQLQQWVSKQPHLPPIEEFDAILSYHASDYSIQKAKELIDLHYSFRSIAPELYPPQDYKPPTYRWNIWDVCYLLRFATPTPKDGYRVVYCGLRDPDASHYHFEIALNAFVRLMTADVRTGGTCPGYLVIFSLEHVCLQHLSTVSIPLVRKFLYFVQEAVPVKVRGVHIIHVTPIIDKVMFIAKPFIKKSLMDIIHFHADLGDLHKHVPKCCLPRELGGTLSVTRDQLAAATKEMMECCRQLLDEDMERRADESKRIASGVTKGLLMEEGSFKKIEFD